MRNRLIKFIAAASMLCVSAASIAGESETSTRDIVLSKIQKNASSGNADQFTGMIVTVYVRDPQGVERPTDLKTLSMRAGDSFKIEVRSAVNGTISIDNVTPDGRVVPLITNQRVAPGSVVMLPEAGSTFEVRGRSGKDLLVVKLLPAGATVQRDIAIAPIRRQDVQGEATYFGGAGRGAIEASLEIWH